MDQIDQEIDGMPHLGTVKVPNSTGVLVLGILSIFPGCFCYGLLGVIMGIISISLASGANKLIKKNPTKYSESSIQLVKAGKICGIIGLCVSSLYIIYLIGVLIFVGSLAMYGSSLNY